ncbi:Transposase and inactivated derivative [Paramagnetospirillum magneticum AMB-1]|uniref:Transposase and inactivated derivative n=1 Tax=Paramagnetospirillum magneticum (strain ATCC 700264 / AMB-1) TaxID=342108 RepID=Q2W1Z8_PARM1|nr:Transposase and inactivated derivative [Paramagnetospirillum magneticum AMB-1]
MGKVTRKRYSAEFKSKVALEAIKGEQTLAELAAKYEIHHTMIAQWKRQAIEGMSATFSGKSEATTTGDPAEIERLHAKIGQLLVERDFLRDASVRLGLIRGGK